MDTNNILKFLCEKSYLSDMIKIWIIFFLMKFWFKSTCCPALQRYIGPISIIEMSACLLTEQSPLTGTQRTSKDFAPGKSTKCCLNLVAQIPNMLIANNRQLHEEQGIKPSKVNRNVTVDRQGNGRQILGCVWYNFHSLA